jgi:predicted kinase
MSQTVTFLIGIPGCGKSTYIKEHIDTLGVIVCPDDIRRDLTGTVSDQTKNREVWTTATEVIKSALQFGNNVTLDATNVKSSNRSAQLKELRRYCNDNDIQDVTYHAIVLNIDPEIAKERIHNDIDNGINRANVPDDVIDRMYNELQNGFGNLTTQFDTFESIHND